MKVYACVCVCAYGRSSSSSRLESCRLMEGSGGFANLCPGVFGGTSHFGSSSELGTVAAAYHANPACMRNHATL